MNGQEILIGVSAYSTWEPAGASARNISWSGSNRTDVLLEKPNLRSVPPIHRRRLSSLARVVFHLLEQCACAERDEPVVFSSVMGEIQRTQGILESLAADQQVSPAAFSLSVHNAIGGLWSLIHGVQEPVLSMAPPWGSPMPAFLEALGMLGEKAVSGVLVCCYEEDYPDFYTPFLDGPEAPTALAMRLVPVSAEERDCSLVLAIRLCERDERDGDHTSLLELLHAGQGELQVREPRCNWQIRAVA